MGASLGSCLSACRNKHIASVADAVVRFFFCKSLGSGWIWMNLLVFLLLVVVSFEYIFFSDTFSRLLVFLQRGNFCWVVPLRRCAGLRLSTIFVHGLHEDFAMHSALARKIKNPYTS